MIAAVLAVLVALLLLLPLGVWFRYDDGALTASVTVGPVTVYRYPSPPKEPKGKKKAAPAADKPSAKKKLDFKKWKPLLSIALDLLGKLRRKLLVRDLYVCVRCGSGDAARTALQYGKAWALIGSLDPVLHNCFRIANRQAEVLCDYESNRLRLLLEMDVHLRVGSALWLGLQALCRLVPVLQQNKKKAVQ